MKNNNQSMHWLAWAVILVIIVVVIISLVLIYTQAVSVTTQTEVGNVDPEVDTLYVSNSAYGGSNDFGLDASGIGLVAGSTKTIHVNGTVSDTNGAGDFDNVALSFWRENVGSSCTADNNDCYKNASCSTQANDDTHLDYNCQVDLQFYADATDTGSAYASEAWRATVTVTDTSSGLDAVSNIPGDDVKTLLALDIPTTIDYGTLTNNEKTDVGNNQEKTITQQGNDEADVEVSSVAAMTCTVNGTIPVANQAWTLSDRDFDGSTPLSGIATDTNLNVGYRTNDATPLTKTLYWNIHIPYDSVGTCTGTNTVTAIAH